MRIRTMMSKQIQKIYHSAYVTELLNKVENGEIQNYSEEIFPIEERFPAGESLIEVDTVVKLQLPEGRETYDLENSIAIYNAFNMLNETQATDKRLWTYLAHVTFWNYMRKRWPIEKFSDDAGEDVGDGDNEKKKINFIIRRYFLKNTNTRQLIRHGISRLWWYAHLTYDKSRKDPFELTKVLLSDQDLAQNILERISGHNRDVLKAFLEYIKDHKNELSRDEIRNKLKRLTLIGGVKLLPVLEKSKLENLLN